MNETIHITENKDCQRNNDDKKGVLSIEDKMCTV